MSKALDWIKDLIAVVTTENLGESEKKGYFFELENKYNEFSNEEKKEIRNIISRFEYNDLIFVLSSIIQYMNVDVFGEDIMKYLIKGDFDWLTGAMLELQVAVKVKGQYAKKRIFHKKNITRFDKLLKLDYPYVKVENRNKKRIAIMTEHVLNELHAPTKVVLDFAYVLQEYMGYEVMIFACPCDARLPYDLWHNPVSINVNPEYKDFDMLINHKGKILRGYQVNMTQSSPKEYSMMLSMIYYWNPLFVFEMGAINPIMDVMNKFTTVVAMSMSIGCPISEGEILFRLDKTDDELEQIYSNSLNRGQKQIFADGKIPVVVKKSNKENNRSDFGLSDDQYLIAIVGNRLDVEVDDECVQLMKEILKQVHNVAFLIIGEVDTLKNKFTDTIFDERVLYLGFCEDLMGVYNIVDLYMNPQRKGGGFSSSMAIQAGVPVVTLPNCDVAYNVGEEFVVENYEQMKEIICKYATDSVFFEKQKEQAEVNSKRNSQDSMVKYVENAIGKIISEIESEK